MVTMEERLTKMTDEEIQKMIDDDCLTEAEIEFFNNGDGLTWYERLDGFDYLNVHVRKNNVSIFVFNKPIHGNGKFMTTDINAKDITVDEAIEMCKIKYKGKTIKVVYMITKK